MSDKKVYPHPSLAERNEYLKGIGHDGAELPEAEAEDLLARGFVTRRRHPDLVPFHNAAEAAEEAAEQGKKEPEAMVSPDSPELVIQPSPDATASPKKE